jgi:hypothetical protein
MKDKRAVLLYDFGKAQSLKLILTRNEEYSSHKEFLYSLRHGMYDYDLFEFVDSPSIENIDRESFDRECMIINSVKKATNKGSQPEEDKD